MNAWYGSPPQPPCYRIDLAADLDAVLADHALDVALVARTLAAATVGLSGRELADFMARLRDCLRGSDGRGGPADSVARTRGDVRPDAEGSGDPDARPVPAGRERGVAIAPAPGPRASRQPAATLPGFDGL